MVYIIEARQVNVGVRLSKFVVQVRSQAGGIVGGPYAGVQQAYGVPNLGMGAAGGVAAMQDDERMQDMWPTSPQMHLKEALG